MLIEKDPTLRNVSFLQLLEESKNSPIKIFMPVQRNYVWCDDFVARLCYEFHHVVTLFEKKAYLNDIIKSRITNYLTDGQQRTTSCLILVRILVYLFEKKKKEFMANLAGGGVNDIVFDELHDDWQRYKIDNITNQDEFFDRFYYTGNEEAELINAEYRASLSNENLDRILTCDESRFKPANRYEAVARIFYDFVHDFELTVGKGNWKELLKYISFTEKTFDIKEGEEKGFAENFAVTNSYIEPMNMFTILRTMIGDDNFFKLLKKCNNGTYDYLKSDITMNTEDVFVKHCMQAFLLIRGYKGDIVTDGVCFGKFKNLNPGLLFTCLKDDVVIRNDGYKKLGSLCADFSKFYYDVVKADKIPYITFIKEIGGLSTLISSIFVLYRTFYESDRKKFDMCMRYIYTRLLFNSISVDSSDKKNKIDIRIREFVYNVIRDNSNEIKLECIPTYYDVSSSCYHLDDLTQNNMKKSKFVLRFLEFELRNITDCGSGQNQFPTFSEYKDMDVDHFIPVGKDRNNFSEKNIIGNYFLNNKSDNRSKSDKTSIAEIIPGYSRSPYFTTSIFALGRDSMADVKFNRFEKLLEEISNSDVFDKDSKIFNGSVDMVELFRSLIINESSLTLEYIRDRSQFIFRLFTYLLLKRCNELMDYFGTEDEEVEFAEAEMEYVES